RDGDHEPSCRFGHERAGLPLLPMKHVGGRRMFVTRSDDRITLHFELSPNQQAMTVIFSLVMAGFVLALLYSCARAILDAAAGRALEIVPFLLGCAALAAYNGISTLLNQDCTTVFDLEARTVTLTRHGLIARQSGPVAFDAITGLGTRVGFADRHRSVIA